MNLSKSEVKNLKYIFLNFYKICSERVTCTRVHYILQMNTNEYK